MPGIIPILGLNEFEGFSSESSSSLLNLESILLPVWWNDAPAELLLRWLSHYWILQHLSKVLFAWIPVNLTFIHFTIIPRSINKIESEYIGFLLFTKVHSLRRHH